MNWFSSRRNGQARLREHSKEELSHYSNGTSDIDTTIRSGWGEGWGRSRTNHDLTQHQNAFQGQSSNTMTR